MDTQHRSAHARLESAHSAEPVREATVSEPGTATQEQLGLPWFAWLLLAMAGAAFLVVAIAVVSASMRVDEAWPPAGEKQAATTAPIRIVFSQDPDAGSVEAHFSIEPQVDGDWAVEGDEAVFLPARALDPGQVYTVTLEAGIRGKGYRELASAFVWSFRTRHPQLLYLGRTVPAAGVRQIFTVLPGGVPRQLTDHAQGLWDYAVHPQGEGIVYSALREDGGADLWHIDRDGGDQQIVLACPEAACLSPAWSPDGELLAYERRAVWAGGPNLDPKAGRLWFLDLETGEERPLFDYEVALHSPVWAPKGRRLAYVSPTIPGVEVYDLDTGKLQQFANQWGAQPAWSPEGTRLVLPELLMAGEEMAVRLVRIDLRDERLADISGDDDFVRDVAPAWSPGGGWIAMGRQYLDDERWTPGRQLWLTRPDASEAYGLPGEAMADHYAPAWRPDGGALAYARANLSQGSQAVPDVSVWVFDFSSGASQFISDDAMLPGWLP